MKKFLLCFLFGLFIAAVYGQSAYAAEYKEEYYNIYPPSNVGFDTSLVFSTNYKVGDSVTLDIKNFLSSYSLKINDVDLPNVKSTDVRQTVTFQITQEMFDNNPNQIVLTTRGKNGYAYVTVYKVRLERKLLYPNMSFSGGLLDGQKVAIEGSGMIQYQTTNLTDNDFSSSIEFYPLTQASQIRVNPLLMKNVKYLRIYAEGSNPMTLKQNPLTLKAYSLEKPSEAVTFTVSSEYFNGKPMELVGFPENTNNVVLVTSKSSEVIYEWNLYDKLPGQFDNVSDVKYSATDDSLSFSYTVPENFSHLKVYVDDELQKDMVEGSSFTLDNLKPNTSYNLKFVSYSKDGEMSVPNNYEVKTEPLKPPSDVTNVEYKIDYRSLHMTYDLPTEDNFSHLEVYKNNVKILSKVTDKELNFDDLKPSTDYTYKIVAVSDKGAKSEGYTLSFKTKEYKDEEPPEKPTGLNVTNGNESLVLAWDKNSEFDLEGYYVYLDGKKITDKPIKSNVYTVPDLENGKTYHVEVSAIDTSGNESGKAARYGSPNTKGMPIFKAGYSLADVSNGVGSWFSSIWLLLAFSVSIPLAFYISHRVKALFFT